MTQDIALQRLEDQLITDAQTIKQHGEDSHVLELALQESQYTLSMLRSTEEAASFANPYERGNARYERLHHNLMLLDEFATAPTTPGGEDNSSNVEASNPPPPPRTEFEEAITYWDRGKRNVSQVLY
jgi:hypothetical protein